jgi:hypothetical protein
MMAVGGCAGAPDQGGVLGIRGGLLCNFSTQVVRFGFKALFLVYNLFLGL